MELLTDAQRALFVTGGSLADYDVLKPIGKGKFSVVYKAQRLKGNGEAVALKKIAIFDLMDARAREKTLKEVRLVQSVSHENIVQYLDAFIDGKELYIAFEWADAGDLKRQIRKANERHVRLEERTIWRYFAQLCAAILHLHRARIMHRDLKPANILLTTQGMIKVGDLGLGRHLSEDTLEAHSKVGTPLYMSPEVLKGEGYDWKSDVWSLGCILYELAMLRSPFKSEGLNLYGLFQKINKGDYEPVPDSYSDHLRDLVTRMISLDARQRPTMEQVWEACQTRPSTPILSSHEQPTQQVQLEAAQRIRGEENLDAATVRRNIAHSSPTRAPSPATSRPSSQQSDGGDRSTHSSRPTSSKKASVRQPAEAPAADKDIAQRHEEMAMELLYARLTLLPSDGDAEAAALQKRLARHHFASESRFVPAWTQSPHERFRDLCRVSSWMLSLLGETHEVFNEHDHQWRQDDAPAPIMRAQMLLLAAERAGVRGAEISQVSAASLTRGCGLDAVLFLTALSEAALLATCSRRQRPVYPRETVDTMEANEQWEVQSDDHDVGTSGDSTASMPLQNGGSSDDECGGLDARWLVVRETKRPMRDAAEEQAAAMIHSRVDAGAWRREVARVQTKLKERLRDSGTMQQEESAWHARLDILRRQSEAVAAAMKPTCEVLREASKVCEHSKRRVRYV
jgi:serine/threonine protein kinase